MALKEDSLGDYCKFFENQETQRLCLPGLPVYARLDGRGFSKFTKKIGFKKPYDETMSAAMICTMHYLVDEFDATLGYTQSDEISIGWVDRPIIFNGKYQKMISTLAATASVVFYKQIAKETEFVPTFDCRIFPVPSRESITKQFLWRELDCAKNAITMAAQEFYSHNELMNKNSSQKQNMLHLKGKNFNDYPAWFKRGTFCLRRTISKQLEPEILAKIPENKRPTNPVTRSCLFDINLPRLLSISNLENVLFNGELPTLKEEK